MEVITDDWICSQTAIEINAWIIQNIPEKIQKYLNYDWNNPSERVRQHMENLVSDEINNPISTLCENGDPSNGQLLKLLLHFMQDMIQDSSFKDQLPFLSIAVKHSTLTIEQLRMILALQLVPDPLAHNPEGTDYDHQKTSAIELAIRADNLEYFKELIKHSKHPRKMDKALKMACRQSTTVLKYLIEDEGMSASEVVCGKTPLQHALLAYGLEKPAADYLLSRGSDITVKDQNGNLTIFYACVYGYNDTTSLIKPGLDLHTKTNKMKCDRTYLVDGVTAFGVAAMCNQYTILKQLLEFKSTLPHDPELDRQIIADVIFNGDYIAIWTMWPYVNTRDIVSFLTTEHMYEHSYGEMIKPIQKMFRDYQYIQEKIDLEQYKWDLMRQESKIRALWRHALDNFSSEEIETLLNTETKDGNKLRYFIESQTLLPDAYRLSNSLWGSEIEYNLGSLGNLPREIVRIVFSYLAFNDACNVVSVSKSWFKETTAKQIWILHPKVDPNSSNPFRAIQKQLTNNHIRSRFSECFRQIVRVDDGEGLLVMESGFLTGLKLNGEPIISSWPQDVGSICRCMVRSRALSQQSIESSVKQIESVLNTGDIDFESLVDTLMPFMKCLPSGFYDVSVHVRGDYGLYEYTSESDPADVNTGFPIRPLLYCTQPSDLLNETRIKFYEEQIQKGLRPAALAIAAHEEMFVIDGHHKIMAYKNLGLLEELNIICIAYNDAEAPNHKIPLEEEMKYLTQSRDVQEEYEAAKQSMRFNDHE